MHARSRKIPLAEPSRDEITDAFPPDDGVVIEIARFAEPVEETRANERICLTCGSDGSRHEGCDHAEVARLHESSRAAGELVARLKRAAAEHRAASRVLRALVTSELQRGRAEIETTPNPAIAAAVLAAKSAPCGRCAERDAEMVAAVLAAPKVTRKRGRAAVDQQTLLFNGAAAPAADEDPPT